MFDETINHNVQPQPVLLLLLFILNALSNLLQIPFLQILST